MHAYHYLGSSLAKIGEILWYVATYLGEWVALLIRRAVKPVS
jgi:hypothetical protein